MQPRIGQVKVGRAAVKPHAGGFQPGNLLGFALVDEDQLRTPTTRLLPSSSVFAGGALGSWRPIAESPGPANRKEIKSKV
jgi:hypothetical protein